MRVGSLFAGIGGFDLGFHRAGFEVAWCVEWDKNAQAVLRKRFPGADVRGDITQVDPSSLSQVDVICGGFPCQDLSVAGKRAGLAGSRSGLFHDAMRIVRHLRPELLVLENVPGLLSSNRGLDFATVLREVGEGWPCSEVAWRVLDSRYFGVAQRRRRVFVVAGPRAGCAESILALSEGVRWHPAPRIEARKGTAADAAPGSGTDDREWPARIAPTLNCAFATKQGLEDQHALGGAGCFVPQFWDGSQCASTVTRNSHLQNMPDRGNFSAILEPDQVAPTVTSKWAKGSGGPSGSETGNLIVERGSHWDDETVPHSTAYRWQNDREGLVEDDAVHLRASQGSSGFHEMNHPVVAFRKSKRAQSVTDDETWVEDQTTNTLNGFDTGDVRTTEIVTCVTGDPTHPLTSAGIESINFQGGSQQDQIVSADQISPALAHSSNEHLGHHQPKIINSKMLVRRLTPTECERLQGFPDGWTQIGTPEKPTADSHRYRQLGNAVTVNVAEWIARRAAAFINGGTP